MSTLWTSAMAWQEHSGEEGSADDAMHVKDAGFAGLVQHPNYASNAKMTHQPFSHKVWNDVEPEPSDDDFKHFDEHFDFPPSYNEKHQKAYDDHMAKEKARDVPDHTDHALMHFQRNEGVLPSTWENKGTLGKVDISGPVHATQSHVNQSHLDRYSAKPSDKSWWEHRSGRTDETGYKGSKHPMFVTHQGRLHVLEGHHRVAAALQRGDSHIEGWHYDADKHGFPSSPA